MLWTRSRFHLSGMFCPSLWILNWKKFSKGCRDLLLFHLMSLPAQKNTSLTPPILVHTATHRFALHRFPLTNTQISQQKHIYIFSTTIIIIIITCCYSYYITIQGILTVRQEVSDFLLRRDGFPADPADIFLTNGASEGVRLCMQVSSSLSIIVISIMKKCKVMHLPLRLSFYYLPNTSLIVWKVTDKECNTINLLLYYFTIVMSLYYY